MALHAARAIRQKHKAAPDSPTVGGGGSSSAGDSLSDSQRRALEEAFEAADKNGDGVLSAEEYRDIFLSHGLSIDRDWIERTIARHDRDGDGGISLEEFFEMRTRTGAVAGPNAAAGSPPSSTSSPGPSTSSSVPGAAAAAALLEKAKLAFNAYDRNRDGYVTKTELRKTSKNMTDAQIDAVFDRYDRNKDGRLDFDEFKELMVTNKKQPDK